MHRGLVSAAITPGSRSVLLKCVAALHDSVMGAALSSECHQLLPEASVAAAAVWDQSCTCTFWHNCALVDTSSA